MPWRITFKGLSGDHWLLCPTIFKSRIEAIRAIAVLVGYPKEVNRISRFLREEGNYVFSDRTDIRYSLCRHYDSMGTD